MTEVSGPLHVYAASADEIMIQQCDNNNAGKGYSVWQGSQAQYSNHCVKIFFFKIKLLYIIFI